MILEAFPEVKRITEERGTTMRAEMLTNKFAFGLSILQRQCILRKDKSNQYTTSTNRALGVWAEIWGERISRRPLSQPGSI